MDKWTMYHKLMLNAEADGKRSTAQWAKRMRDLQKPPIASILDDLCDKLGGSRSGANK